MRPQGWAALLATAGWAALVAPALATYSALGTVAVAALAVLVLVPTFVSATALAGELRARAAVRSPVPDPAVPWIAAKGYAVGAAGILAGLVLVGLAATLPQSAADVELRQQVGERIADLVPGPSTVWAVVVATILTVVAVGVGGRPQRGPIAIAASTLVAGGAFIWAGVVAAAPVQAEHPAACADDTNASIAAHAVAAGDVDGRSLGTVVGTLHEGGPTTVAYATAWGRGSADLRDVGSGRVFTTGALDAQARSIADDVGTDRVGDGPARHCRMVIDGRTAVEAFPLLRWMVGGNEDSPDAGDALIAWRGTLDYWIVRSDSEGTARLRLATVELSGQAPDWPVGPGLRATLRAASSFGVR